jgi:hypothetical protein
MCNTQTCAFNREKLSGIDPGNEVGKQRRLDTTKLYLHAVRILKVSNVVLHGSRMEDEQVFVDVKCFESRADIYWNHRATANDSECLLKVEIEWISKVEPLTSL